MSWEVTNGNSPTELTFCEGFKDEELEPRFFSFFFDQLRRSRTHELLWKRTSVRILKRSLKYLGKAYFIVKHLLKISALKKMSCWTCFSIFVTTKSRNTNPNEVSSATSVTSSETLPSKLKSSIHSEKPLPTLAQTLAVYTFPYPRIYFAFTLFQL